MVDVESTEKLTGEPTLRRILVFRITLSSFAYRFRQVAHVLLEAPRAGNYK